MIRIQDENYITDILRLPEMSFLFNELDFNKALKENQRHIRIHKISTKKIGEGENEKVTF